MATELATITPEVLKIGDNNYIKDRAPNFRLFFRQLKNLLSENVLRDNQLVSPTEQLTLDSTTAPDTSNLSSIIHSTTESKKRPNSLSIITSSPTKVRPTSSLREQDSPHTPDQPTIPKNPDDTGDSVESIDEDNTKQMMKIFIDTILDHLEPDFGQIMWPSYAQKCQLYISGFSPTSVICLSVDTND